MAKVIIEVLDAVIDGKRKGEQLEVSEKDAQYFESIKYAKIVGEAKSEVKAETKSAPKAKK